MRDKNGRKEKMDICAVIVTYNRLACLEKALSKYENQTKLPKYLLIVNNNSSDGTRKYLEKWEKMPHAIRKIVINLSTNTGGAGGFYVGMEKALSLDCDWIWISDDDAYPERDAFELMELFTKENLEIVNKASALCSTVMDGDARSIRLGHRMKERRILGIPCMPNEVKIEEYRKPYFSFDYLSYVGSMIRKSSLEKVGLPNKDFFIYSDDFEHSIRLRSVGELICVTSSCVLHDGESSVMPTLREAVWRDYYATRNVLLALKWHYGMLSFYMRAAFRIITALRSGNVNKIRIFWEGICDAKHDVVGIHPIYKPGWKSSD